MNQSEFLRKIATEGKKIAKKSLGQNFLVNAEIIEKIANSKVKDYKSLTNKSLFKFMDLIEM